MKDETKYMSQCPEFSGCSSPKCPLDPLINKRVRYKEDTECIAQQKTRYDIGKTSTLRYRGLFRREWNDFIYGWGKLIPRGKKRH